MSYLPKYLLVFIFILPCLGLWGQSYSGCVITGVDYAVRTDFPIYVLPTGTSESYAASGCMPQGAQNSVMIYQNSFSSGDIGSRCYNISPSPSNYKNCKVVVSGISRCGYVATVNFVQCPLDGYSLFSLGALASIGFVIIRKRKT